MCAPIAAYLETFGYDDFEDIESMSILDMVAPDDADDFKSLLKRLSKGERPPQKLNLKAQRARRHRLSTRSWNSPKRSTKANPASRSCSASRRPIRASPRNSTRCARKDLVTELFNRQYLTTELDRAAAAAASGKTEQALILLELDNYKTVLDGIGLGNTDLLLGDMANLLRRHLKETDIPGRLGEHTFGILVHDRSAEAVGQLAETLRKAFEERIFEVGKNSINLTISVGRAP